MRMSNLVSGWLVVLLAASAGTAQNLVKNGGFEQGVTNWQLKGGKFYANVESRDCNGDGRKSKAFVVTPDSGSNPFFLTQKIALKKGTSYWFRAAVRGIGSLASPNYSRVTAYIGVTAYAFQQHVATVDVHRSGKSRLLDFSARAFKVSGNYTWLTLRFEVRTRAGLGSAITLDDIQVFEGGVLPWATCTTDRQNTPKTIGLQTFGTPGSLYLIELGTKRLSPPVKIPGIGGLLELDPSGGLIQMANGVFGTQGLDRVTLPLPAPVYAVIRGLPLYWMPVQITSLPTTITLGKAPLWGFQ